MALFYYFCVYTFLLHCNKKLFILWSCTFCVSSFSLLCFYLGYFVLCRRFRRRPIISASIIIVFMPMTTTIMEGIVINGIYDYTIFVNNGKYNVNIYNSSHGQLCM
jgi:hypothetical protein